MNDSVDAEVADSTDLAADAPETAGDPAAPTSGDTTAREASTAAPESADSSAADNTARTTDTATPASRTSAVADATATAAAATSDADIANEQDAATAVADSVTSAGGAAATTVADEDALSGAGGATAVVDDATSAGADAATSDVGVATSDADDATSDAEDTTSAAKAEPAETDALNSTTYDATPVAKNTVAEFTPEHLEDAEFRSALEAMLLVVDAPAPVEQLAAALDDTTERVDEVLREMRAELSARGSGIDLRFVGDGWRFYTRSEYAPYVERVLLDGARTKLTRAALETLAVVAYRQPVTRTRVSAVRGVNVDGVMRTLLARGLLAEAGVDPETNGTTYCTTELFLERIGLASLTDLPPLAPLLPGVDLIDEINESLDTDPRYTRLKKPAEADLDLGSED